MAVNFSVFVWITVLCIGGSYWLSRKLNLRWRPGLWLRVGFILLILLGIFTAVNDNEEQPFYPREVLLLDQSESIAEGQIPELKSFAIAWKNAQPNRQVIVYGQSSDVLLGEQWPESVTAGSDLAGALETAGGLAAGKPGRLVIATDGNVDDILAVDEQLSTFMADGYSIDYIPLISMAYENDVFVRDIISASTVWEGNTFPIAAKIYSPLELQGQARVFVNGQLYSESPIALEQGERRYAFLLQAGTPGIMSIELRILVDGDEFPNNNFGYKSLLVYESPDILLVTKNPEVVEDFSNDLERENGKVTVIYPGEFPTSLNVLSEYEVVLVHDLLARDFNVEQMQALNIHVVEKGRSVVFFGGKNSYTLGGYEGTLLESMLPVVLEPPERIERVPVTFVLVLDRSGSMASDRNSDISPMELTREAAMRALETLRPEDYFGVLSFSGEANWEANIQQLESGVNLRLAQDAVSQIIANGGTLMYQALEEAISDLGSVPSTDNLHILLMSDGESGDGSLGEFRDLVASARQQGISVSTISLGNESDPETLSLIAEVGNGRYYQVLNASELPNVMISETKAVQSENVQTGRTNLILGVDNHPALAGFQLNDLPVTDAYIALQSKASRGAEDILVSGSFGDPILSSWQLGLGHVSAWMGDIGEEWMPGMRNWDDQGAFWMQFFRYTLPNPSFGNTEVVVVQSDEALTVEFSLQNELDSASLSGAPEFVFRIGGELRSFPMMKTAPQKYKVGIPLPTPGAYQGVVRYFIDGEERESFTPIAVDFPSEWLFSDPTFDSEDYVPLKTNLANSGKTIEAELASTAAFSSDSTFDWYYFVLFLVLLSWPVEIGIRRWQMPWRRP